MTLFDLADAEVAHLAARTAAGAAMRTGFPFAVSKNNQPFVIEYTNI
jgi:hypothetical protein